MNYKGKKVLILGLGLNEGGVGSARFFAKNGAEVLVTDLKNETELAPSLEKLQEFSNIKYSLGGHKFEDIDWADIVIKNIAIKPGNEYVEYAKQKGKEVQTDIGIFLNEVSPKQIIGVTGTKGKSTTASLIYYAARKKYPNLILAGNIGKSVLDALEKIDDKTLVILEISSFQLQPFGEKKVSPHFAVITNIFPDHLNYHKDMDEYVNAKKVIAKFQTDEDFLFLNTDDKTINSKEFVEGLKGKIIKFSSDDLPTDFMPTLKGEHNKLNYAAGLAVAKGINVPEDEALKNMNQFTGADYRLQKVYDKNGIIIINDSASTNPDAGIAALKTYPNSIFIVGGMNKGLNYEELALEIAKSAKSVYLIEGSATDELRGLLKNEIIKGTFNDLEKLLEKVKQNLDPEERILFSPSATSFNIFHNEFDRGEKFNEAVEKVFK